MADLSQEQVQKVLQGISIPPQPQIMVDLQMEQMMPDCDINAIAKLISQDIGLAGSVLKTVNSPLYGLGNNITSINQAVNLLGVNSVINLVNGLSIRGELSDDQIVAMGKFWDSSMEVAMAAAAIAKNIGFPCPDEAYTLGLFHNCGIPLLMMRFDNYPEVLKRAYADPERRIIDTENDELNTNHAVVGYYVAKSWNLPTYLCQAIHEHHSIRKIVDDESADPKKKTLLAVLKMAEHICGNYRTLGDQEVDNEWQIISESVLLYVGLSQYDFESLQQQISEMGLGHSGYYC
ncbi:MAG: HDOD domain-containing protein [Candidatus Pelagadaptatus aseana]|uniref:HDOD domain-containing protein n=1 Tax=Candidatus Pelagadaptatus aseana TaxID=3120508 RepID=UPI0039B15A69